MTRSSCARAKLETFLVVLLVSLAGLAQDRKVDATWLHRYVPDIGETRVAFSSESCHYKAIFGEGDGDGRTLQSVARFGQVLVDAHGTCQNSLYANEEELYFILSGSATLTYGQASYVMRSNDFTYLPPGIRHGIGNRESSPLELVVMGFKIPTKVHTDPPAAKPKIVNLDQVKEETVQGHPTSVLYKLLAGPRTGKRDAMDQAYVVTSLFWMDFAPGGTNFPHHHETAEEIYLVIEGHGDMVAGGGMDGIEGRHPAQPGDAYYFRSNCTVGFYNQNKPGVKAQILAVRSRIPIPDERD
jgi:mannose-6-phosphate isomerase-like protein (cupin superfamily)